MIRASFSTRAPLHLPERHTTNQSLFYLQRREALYHRYRVNRLLPLIYTLVKGKHCDSSVLFKTQHDLSIQAEIRTFSWLPDQRVPHMLIKVRIKYLVFLASCK